MSTADGEPARGVERLLDEARAAFNRYQFAEGTTLLQHAQALVAEADGTIPAPLRLRVRLTGTWLTFDRLGPAQAERELAELRGQSLDLGHAALAAACDVQSATLLSRMGDIGGAAAAMARAEEHRAAMPVEDQVRLIMHRAVLRHQLDDIDRAAADFALAAQLARDAGLRTLQFKALHNQGCAAFVQGDLAEALRLMDAAARSEPSMNVGVTALDRARVLAEAGLVRDAAAALHDAATHFGAAGLHREVAEIAVDLARCEALLGRPEQAVERALSAAATFARRGEPHWESRARLVALQALGQAARGAEPGDARGADQRGPTPPADAGRQRLRVALATRVVARAEQLSEGTTAALARVELAAALSDLAGSAPAAHRAAGLREAGEVLDGARGLTRSPFLAARLSYAHARVQSDIATGRSQAARARLARAAEDLAGAQRRTAGLDARAALAVHARRLADLDVELTLRDGDAIGLLLRMERWRRAVAPLTPVRPSADPDEALLLSRLRLAREQLAHAQAGAAAQARADVRRLERAASATRWRAATLAPGPAQRAPTVPLVREALARVHAGGAAVLGLLAVGDRVVAVVARPDAKPVIVDVGPAGRLWAQLRRVSSDSDAAARAADDPHLAGVVRRAARHSVAGLDALLAPALEPVRSAPLVVLAGSLQGAIPWGMLPSRRGVATTIAPSLLAWAVPREDRPGPAGATTPIAALAGPGVPQGPDEASRVLAAWGTTPLALTSPREAPCASRSEFIAALGEADVVHVAAHGEHQPESPLFSCLRLADGPVFAHELESHPVSAGLVVLSACDTGRITSRPGEEALGWPSALTALGVRTVIAPLVAIRDDETHRVMPALHEGLAAGLPADVALARAASALEDGMPFVCFGRPWPR